MLAALVGVNSGIQRYICDLQLIDDILTLIGQYLGGLSQLCFPVFGLLINTLFISIAGKPVLRVELCSPAPDHIVLLRIHHSIKLQTVYGYICKKGCKLCTL
ncbi:hypothetical protein D3C72_959430 [compost metagenome]